MIQHSENQNSRNTSSSAVTILDRVLSAHASSWTEEEAEGIVKLVVNENNPLSDGHSSHQLAEQFGIFLELVKCRARMRLRTIREE